MKNQSIILPEFGIQNLQVFEAEMPERQTGGVRVRIHTVSLNYRDLMMVEGRYNPRIPMPLIPLSDGAGTVVESDADSPFQPGDRVMTRMVPGWDEGMVPTDAHKRSLGGPQPGCLRHFADFPASALLPIPDSMDMDLAACVPVAALTAFRALKDAGVGPDSRVLTLGTGGVSLFALQFAKALGAKVAITSSSDQKLEHARNLGADVWVNYKKIAEWDRAVLQHWPEGVDTVIEVGGQGTFNRSVKAARLGGNIALIGVLADEATEPILLTRVLMKNLKVQGTLVGDAKTQAACAQFLVEHGIQPVLHRVFEGLGASQEAFELLASAQHMGKILIRLA
ncbi:MAG: NAD(P)-dependent alcohol dehydrogenase [Acidobacteria bacterium]|nr:NAD(P)-dependent alcohol dehydrogenase [Acidobacteriota bacterium]